MWRLEDWKPVVGYEGRYEVSNLGRIRSVPRRRVPSPLDIKAFPTPKGYLKVSLTDASGKACSKSVHSLVLTTFVGPRPDGREAAHLDGNPANNDLRNLIWATPKQNCAHKK